jgi:hypothetical protein
MEQIEVRTTPTRTRRNIRKAKEPVVVSREEQDLQTHVEICALRYEGIQNQMKNIDERFDRVEVELKDLAVSTNKNLGEIKTLITAAKDEKFKTVITATSTVVVALLGMLGYLITHLPK